MKTEIDPLLISIDISDQEISCCYEDKDGNIKLISFGGSYPNECFSLPACVIYHERENGCHVGHDAWTYRSGRDGKYFIENPQYMLGKVWDITFPHNALTPTEVVRDMLAYVIKVVRSGSGENDFLCAVCCPDDYAEDQYVELTWAFWSLGVSKCFFMNRCAVVLNHQKFWEGGCNTNSCSRYIYLNVRQDCLDVYSVQFVRFGGKGHCELKVLESVEILGRNGLIGVVGRCIVEKLQEKLVNVGLYDILWHDFVDVCNIKTKYQKAAMLNLYILKTVGGEIADGLSRNLRGVYRCFSTIYVSFGKEIVMLRDVLGSNESCVRMTVEDIDAKLSKECSIEDILGDEKLENLQIYIVGSRSSVYLVERFFRSSVQIGDDVLCDKICVDSGEMSEWLLMQIQNNSGERICRADEGMKNDLYGCSSYEIELFVCGNLHGVHKVDHNGCHDLIKSQCAGWCQCWYCRYYEKVEKSKISHIAGTYRRGGLVAIVGSNEDFAWAEKLRKTFVSIDVLYGLDVVALDCVEFMSIEKNVLFNRKMCAIILMVSTSFLESVGVRSSCILSLAERENVHVLWLSLSYSVVAFNPIAALQPVYETTKSIDSLAGHEQDAVFVEIVRKVVKIFEACKN